MFDDDISDYAIDMFVRLFKNNNITLVEWNHDVDHIYLLFKAHSNTEMTKFINAYKSASIMLLNGQYQITKIKNGTYQIV